MMTYNVVGHKFDPSHAMNEMHCFETESSFLCISHM